MEATSKIEPDTLVHLKNHPYPFYFKRVSENGKPIVWGDFSGGQAPSHLAYVESEVEWEDVIYPTPKTN